MDEARLRERVDALLAEHPPASTDRMDFLHARFDAGLAWVHFPEGLGGLGLPRSLQPVVEKALAAAGAPDNDPRRIGIGLGMAAPTILAFGTDEQKRRWLRPLWCGEEVWCQLFSEPGAGSDLAGLATRAVLDGDTWVVNGQKVWTSSAHLADRAILVARTDPDVPKHAGLSYFVLDMHDPGVEVRPLRQITGEAEFNEVFLTDARISDGDRLGAVGEGWTVASATLSHERVAIGGAAFPREFGMVTNVARTGGSGPSCARPRPTSGCCAAGSTRRSPGSPPPGWGRSWPPACPGPRARR
ncbi:acyl-CoA dehydrogenase family protein [Nocardioides aquiterrae]|uniref:Acyl-CoA dehydrogenase n=1 Tax=Nocardioides aquiterrae TaxID=203799 RepID=A0ABP4F4E3_9ACTN